jgi:hypothetical protein
MCNIKDALVIISDINLILSLKWDNFISFEKIKSWPLDETRSIEGVVNVNILHSNTHCRFLTIVPPLKSFNIHWHDCFKTCNVLSGTMVDAEKNTKHKVGETSSYKAFEKHIPSNPSGTDYLYLIVDFYSRSKESFF